jgi:SH3-like domain-containing protein
MLIKVAALSLLTFTAVSADEGFVTSPEHFNQEQQAQVPASLPKPALLKKLEAFKPFTGKVKGKRVRLRASADMESAVIRELSQGELISIIEDKGDFYGVMPTSDSKAYVFRSYVLDNTIEGTRVNVRLKPNTEAPVIAHLNSGDKINGQVCSQNSKWMEIKAPESARFYVAKEFIEHAGGPELKSQYEKRLSHGKQMLEASLSLAKSELKRTYDRIDLEKVSGPLKGLIEEFADIQEISQTAQSELVALQETLLQKRISFLEDKARGIEPQSEVAKESDTVTDKMKLWEPIEEALYLSWSSINEDKNLEHYYEEQKLSAVAFSGVVEAYETSSRNKPGDYLIKDGGQIKACLYSTKIDLQKYIGKKITIYGIERPNNNFAFPSYFVVEAE